MSASRNLVRLGNLLSREGYKAEIDDESGALDVTSIQKFSYTVENDVDDPNHYRLVFPIGIGEGLRSNPKFFEAINNANLGTKLAKVIADENESDSILILVDVLASSPSHFVEIFDRCCDACLTAYDLFNATFSK